MSDPSPQIATSLPEPAGPRVLLVDDDVLTRNRLARALRQRGYQVVETPSRLFGALQLELYDHEAPEIVVCASPMEDECSRLEGSALIVLSSAEAPTSEDGARAVGATALFQKPVDPDEVLVVCELIARPPRLPLLD